MFEREEGGREIEHDHSTHLRIGVNGDNGRGEDCGGRGWTRPSGAQTKCLLPDLMRPLPVLLPVREGQRGS